MTSPSLAISYQASDNLLLYGSAFQRFKSGGFQGAPGNLVPPGRSIDLKAPGTLIRYQEEWWYNRLRL